MINNIANTITTPLLIENQIVNSRPTTYTERPTTYTEKPTTYTEATKR
jgi:hypothetical protein